MKKRKHTWNQWRRNKLENYMAAPQAWALPSPLHCLQSGQGQHKRTVRGGLQWTRSILCRQYVPLHKTSQNQEAAQIQRKFLQRKCNLQISQVQSLFKSMVGLDVESYSKVNLSSLNQLGPWPNRSSMFLRQTEQLAKTIVLSHQKFVRLRKEQRMRSQITINPWMTQNNAKHNQTRQDMTTRRRDDATRKMPRVVRTWRTVTRRSKARRCRSDTFSEHFTEMTRFPSRLKNWSASLVQRNKMK